jgi:hypothetical protein
MRGENKKKDELVGGERKKERERMRGRRKERRREKERSPQKAGNLLWVMQLEQSCPYLCGCVPFLAVTHSRRVSGVRGPPAPSLSLVPKPKRVREGEDGSWVQSVPLALITPHTGLLLHFAVVVFLEAEWQPGA